MFKKHSIAIMFIGLISCLYSNIVINELCYDPIGTDTGHEWIELYNNGETDIELEGAQIQVAGSQFNTVFTFPHYILRTHRFVLIGESYVTEAAFITNLVMQNGDTGTDAVRYVSPDGLYTDTVLYDEPNINLLHDDNGNIAISFATDVQTGYSLARSINGIDTNDCAADFIEESSPTPGVGNNANIDYSLSDAVINLIDYEYILEANINNLSPADNDTITINLNVSLNGHSLNSFNIVPIGAGTNIHFSHAIDIDPNTVGTALAELVLDNDIDLSNNVEYIQIGQIHQQKLSINEILYNPETGNQEWIELYIPPMTTSMSMLTLEDASGNSVNFTLPSLCPDYLVICRDQDLLLQCYPDCPGGSVIETSTFPSLNNNGDTLWLKKNGTVIDSVTYLGNSNKKGYSLERQVNTDSTVVWHYCFCTMKGTPGQQNSIAPPPSSLQVGQVKLLSNAFNPLNNECMHLQYKFSDSSNHINCNLYDLKGIKQFTIASGQNIGNEGELIWNGKDKQGKAFPRGIYILYIEAKNSNNKYFLRKQLTVVLATK